MSVRAIASVGVALCVAVTTLSIYLGIVEHVYVPSTTHAVLASEIGHPLICGVVIEPVADITSTSILSTRWITGCPTVALAIK